MVPITHLEQWQSQELSRKKDEGAFLDPVTHLDQWQSLSVSVLFLEECKLGPITHPDQLAIISRVSSLELLVEEGELGPPNSPGSMNGSHFSC